MRRAHRMAALAVAATVSIGSSAVLPATAAAAIPVFDAGNYAQNLIQAARALEQVNNQISSLQNEAAMLRNMARNLERIDFPELERIGASLERIDRLMGEAEAIGFRVDALDSQFRSLFPGAVERALANDSRAAEARARLESALDGYRHSMTVQAGIVSSIRDDAELLSRLSKRGEEAVGSLQAQQAVAQILALGTKQQLQLQALLAAEFRSGAIDRARRIQAEAEARAATRRFLGSGTAYSRGD